MKSQEIVALIATSAKKQKVNNPDGFAKDIDLVLQNSYSSAVLETFPNDFWQKEIPSIISLKKILEGDNESLKNDLAVGPIEHLRVALKEKFKQQVFQSFQN